jgi:hypothetical protein
LKIGLPMRILGSTYSRFPKSKKTLMEAHLEMTQKTHIDLTFRPKGIKRRLLSLRNKFLRSGWNLLAKETIPSRSMNSSRFSLLLSRKNTHRYLTLVFQSMSISNQ